jgi:hypothetical protein
MTPHAPQTPTPGKMRLHPAVEVSIAAGVLALFVLLLYFPLLFTNRVLASGDILLYFYPYREYAAAAVREGRLPLWNPYIFLGVPFLANPQAAVLYPLHWPLSWLPVTQQIYWSAALHTWLLGLGGLLLLRRWAISTPAALVGALVLAGSGFYGGLIGHLNQMNGAAWLPWAVWILEFGFWRLAADGRADRRRGRQSWGLVVAGLALIVALMLLAGHTQTAYINLFGVGVWCLWRIGMRWWAMRRSGGSVRHWVGLAQPLLMLLAGSLLGALLSAAQLLPTLELSALGLRSGGLSYAEATSFSLKPLQLPWTLLPSYGLLDPGALFNTPAYTEFIAYVGLIGLALAAIGAWQGRGLARTAGLLLVAAGFLLALGRWNPLYYLLYLVVPGFDLFRTPARWMMLYTLGMAILAGVGVYVVRAWIQTGAPRNQLVVRTPQPLLAGVLILSVMVELWLAAQMLPHRHPTAPQAVYEVRTAPAHLLTDPQRAALDPAAMGRFLGMSTITYDPGDLGDWRRIMLEGEQAQLTPQTFEQLIIALKVQELMAPNLSLFWRLPAVDGFDGGVLPLGRYNEFLTLFIPREELVPDGRLREQLRAVPPTPLLNLLHAQYLITDKVRDLWFEDIFYDRQIGARLRPGFEQVTVEAPQPFSATHIDLIAALDGPAPALEPLADQSLPVATLTVTGQEETFSFPLTAGGQPGAQLADGALDSPLAARSGATVAYRDVEGGKQEYRVRLALPVPTVPLTVTIQRLATPFDVVVQAITLVDERTGMFTPLLPSDRGDFRLVHSGDVKIYENLDLMPRAYLVNEVIGVEQPAQALAALQAGEVIPGRTAVVEGMDSWRSQPAGEDQATVVAYAPEQVEIRTRSAAQALLVLSDTAFPGWEATVDGVATPIYQTNYLFRGVVVPAGEHTVRFVYRPQSWTRGLWLTGAGFLLWGALLVWGARVSRPSLPATVGDNR